MNHITNENSDKLLRVLVFALVFSVMNGTMFNVALPIIGKDFNLIPSQVSWVMTSYMVIYAIGSVVYGKLADRYRLKDLLTFGLFLFAIGSITGALAAEYWMIILGRLFQAAGMVSYGSTGGARAAEHLRGILGELQVADVRTHPTLSLFTDFENFSTFKPAELHLNNVNLMLDQVIAWSGALKSLR